jgi:hypothetical protein
MVIWRPCTVWRCIEGSDSPCKSVGSVRSDECDSKDVNDVEVEYDDSDRSASPRRDISTSKGKIAQES